MSWKLKAVALLGCLALTACSGGGASGKKQGPGTGLDAGGDSGVGGSGVKGSGDPIKPGDQVDTDGDGTSNGVAVDTDGDGLPDGVDTNGDGTVDQPLPDGSTPVGVDAGMSGSGSGSGSSSDAGIPFPVNGSGQVLCGDHVCACSDGMDNDTDKVTDLADPECVSSWDDDEGSFATGIPGDNRDAKCQDCFFDGNSGQGDDGCRVSRGCYLAGKPDINGSCGRTCEQTEMCKNTCTQYTPNGCDCFGCCEVHLGTGITKNILLSDTCDINGTSLGSGCTECIQNTTCINTCGECELCPGKTTVPAHCVTTPPGGGDGGTGTGGGDGGTGTTNPPGYTCDNGEQVCGSGLPACPSGSLCSFGCCLLSPILI